MSKFVTYIIILILLIAWIASGVYITQASIALDKIKNQSPNITKAYQYALAASLTTWIAVALAIILLVISIVTGAIIEIFESGISGYILLFALLTLTITNGVLSAMVAEKLSDQNVADIRKNAIIAAILSLSIVILLVIGFIGIIAYRNKVRKEKQEIRERKIEEIKELRKKKDEELSQLRSTRPSTNSINSSSKLKKT